MFRLHQSVRRRICQASFCLFCLLPTAVMFGWSISCKLPGHVRACERQLSEQLGLSTRLAGVSYPQPGMCLFEELELADPETGESIFRCRLLEVSRNDDALVLMPSDPVLEADRLHRLWDLLSRRLRGELANQEQMLLLPCSLTLISARGEQTYEVLDGRLESDDRGEAAELRFRLAGVDMPEPASIRVVRNQQHQPPSNRVSLTTGSAALPCSLFAPIADLETVLGARATFAGSLWADDAKAGWEAEIAGRFDEVDLRQLVTGRFPHILDGAAAVEITEARFQRSRLIEAYGRLNAGPGVIGPSLLRAAVDALGCDSRPGSGRNSQSTYSQLAFSFGVDDEGLKLAGACEGYTPGTLLVDGDGRPLLTKSADRPQAVINLLRLLVPASEVLVPATGETADLIPWLPVPPIVPPREADGAETAPRATPRIGDAH
jgi:hypothetical protein